MKRADAKWSTGRAFRSGVDYLSDSLDDIFHVGGLREHRILFQFLGRKRANVAGEDHNLDLLSLRLGGDRQAGPIWQ